MCLLALLLRWTALYPGYGVNVENKKTKNNNLLLKQLVLLRHGSYNLRSTTATKKPLDLDSIAKHEC